MGIKGILFISMFAGALMGVPPASAQVYPSRAVTIVAPYGPGGTTDILARIVAEGMRGPLGRSVVIENVAGASGTIGVGRVARAAPDGYTLGIGNWGTHVVNGAVQHLPYDLLTDLAPIAVLPGNPYVVFANAAVPAKTLAELIAWLKAAPDKATAATGGPGSPQHIIGLFFQNRTGTRFQFVPYRGGVAPALQDLMAGRIDLIFGQPSDVLPHVRDGKIRAFAVMAPHRLAAAPEVPTVDEAGVPGLYVSTWYGLWVPRGTPPDIVARLNSAVVAALADPGVRGRLAELGLEIPPREQQTPEALGAFHKAEIEKWWPIIRAANFAPQ
jgi:tripartite-type tricarboxylate transporter receptor subunit TctC